MSLLETYLLLLTDTIFGNIAIYPSYEFIGFAMKELGGYNPIYILAIASMGFSLAVIINYFCGIILLKIYLSSVESSKRHNYNNFCLLFKDYGWAIILLHLIPPFGNIMPLLCGFTRFSLLQALAIMLSTKMIYYSYYILL